MIPVEKCGLAGRHESLGETASEELRASAAGEPIVSIVMPCLDEAESVSACVTEAFIALRRLGLDGEVLVIDNGSSDGSDRLAAAAGAIVRYVPQRGYGNAYIGGLRYASGRYLVLADADGTYDFGDLALFLTELENGADLVMGSRLQGRIERRAMPWLHRFIGNPAQTRLLNLLSGLRLSDVHCGMRAMTREAYESMSLRSTGMEFASEMILRASQRGLKVVEVPIRYRSRLGGDSKLRTWRDGWRHLRLLLREVEIGRRIPLAVLLALFGAWALVSSTPLSAALLTGTAVLLGVAAAGWRLVGAPPSGALSPLRIALVYDAIYPYVKGGVERRVWELARRLTGRGHEVHLYGMKFWDGPSTMQREGVWLHGVCPPVSMYTTSGSRSTWQTLVFAFRLAPALLAGRFDVIDAQTPAYLACLVSRAVAWLKGTGFAMTWHEAWGIGWVRYFGWRGRVVAFLERVCARLGGIHVAVSMVTAERVRSMGVEGVIAVPNGFDPVSIETVPPDGVGSDIIYVGRLVSDKRVDVVLEAAALLQGQGLDVNVLVVGDGPDRINLEALTAELGVERQVAFAGSVEREEDVVSLMKGASVLVLPSTREGFGLVALEAMAGGVPIVTSDHPNNAARDLVVDGVTGFEVPLTPEQFAIALRKLIEDPQLRWSMGARGRQWVQRFGWPRVVAGMEVLYQRASGSPGR